MRPIFNTLIIGAGDIGALYDNPGSNYHLTHAHAFTSHFGFSLVGFVDSDLEKAIAAKNIWGGEAFKNLKEVFENYSVDVVSVCSPDKTHYEVLKQLHKYAPKLVFAEKPITQTLKEGLEIQRLYSNLNIAICVNYRRRFVPEIIQFSQDVKEGKFGELILGNGIYGKGFLHNGSHLIDLIRMTFGNISDSKIENSYNDFTNEDPSLSLLLHVNEDKPIRIQVIPSHLYTVFELGLFFEKGKVVISDTGLVMEEYVIEEHSVYKGYKTLVSTGQKDTSLSNSLMLSVENIYLHLTKGERLKCDVNEGIKTLESCLKIIDKNE